MHPRGSHRVPPGNEQRARTLIALVYLAVLVSGYVLFALTHLSRTHS